METSPGQEINVVIRLKQYVVIPNVVIRLKRYVVIPNVIISKVYYILISFCY